MMTVEQLSQPTHTLTYYGMIDCALTGIALSRVKWLSMTSWAGT